MRVSVVLCAVMVGLGATAATAQEPLPPNAFGALGMYPKRLSCADLPVYSPPVPTYRLTAAHESDAKLRRAYAPPDTLTIPGGTSAGLQTGQQFFVRRLLVSPNHEQPSAGVPGMVHTAGWITIIGADSFSALARIDHACDHFLRDDYLEPFAAAVMPTTVAAPGAPKFSDMGQLLFGNDGRRSFANGDLIVVNRGSAHGLTAGARLSVFRDTKRGGPLVPVGHAIVLTVAGDTATVIADRVRDALTAGDWFGLEGAPTQP
ncbi:MAG TPA: hypothetical protein VMW48_09205 [Vicinamibacterales bacterium]|nr:hypothetical protein [Vicinamibacterales bacterium]